MEHRDMRCDRSPCRCSAAFLEQAEQPVPQGFLPAESNTITVTGQLAGWLTPSGLMALFLHKG